MGEFLVENDSFNETGIFERTASLGNNLNEVEVYIATLEVSNMEDSLESQVSILVLALADNLGAEGGLSTLSQLGVVVLEDVKFFLYFIDAADSDVTGLLKAIGNLEWVDALFQKFLGLVKDSASKDDNTSCSITDLVILRCGKFSQKSGSLMMDLLQD